MPVDYQRRIQELKLHLPKAPQPSGSYRPVVISGEYAFLSGQISKTSDGRILSGKLGQDLTLEAGQAAAKCAALNVLGVIHDLIGFARFERMIRVVGYVQSSAGFYEISQVMNGASDFFLEVLGESGLHARSAVGMASLPLNAAVEIEATIQIIKSGHSEKPRRLRRTP